MRFIRQALSTIVRLGIGILLLYMLFRWKNIDTARLWLQIESADWFLLGVAFFIFFLNYALCFLRWAFLLRAADIHLPVTRIVISFCGGIFFSLFLPSTIGGDFARSIDLATHTKKPREIVATVLLDRLSGYVGLVIVVICSVLLGWDFIRRDTATLLSVGIIVSLLIGLLFVLFNNFLFSRLNALLHSPNAGRIREALTNLHREIYIFRNHKKVLFENILLSVLIQAVAPFSAYIIARALGISINPLYFFVFIPVIGAITLLPISIGGLGVRENLTVFFFLKAGITQDSALLISLLSFFFILVYGACGGLLYVLTVHHRRVQHHPSPTVSAT